MICFTGMYQVLHMIYGCFEGRVISKTKQCADSCDDLHGQMFTNFENIPIPT